METRKLILELLEAEGALSATEIAARIGISPQATSKQLRVLIDAGRALKEGVTRGARFRLRAPGERDASERSLSRRFDLRGLEEDAVFREIDALLGLRLRLSKAAFSIAGYAFTEILNNAIDHSGSDECRLTFATNARETRFTLRDFGIGAFHSIREKFGLPDEEAAIAEVLKGKATTMPERHSGQGIFFTSKVADRFALRSHRARLSITASPEDTRLDRVRFLRGTQVDFAIATRTRRSIERIFEKYSPEEFDFRFEKTRVLVRLCLAECVSRSEAKRMLARLDQFSEATLDFKGVTALGQAFADEVFRVFMSAHPGVALRIENLSPTLSPMLKGALAPRTVKRITWAD